jgi:hypothetical protein
MNIDAKILNKIMTAQIPRWWLEGGYRKHASYSEILEKHWRHTLQARPLKRSKTLPLHTSSLHRESPPHVKRRNKEGPGPPDAHTQTAWKTWTR